MAEGPRGPIDDEQAGLVAPADRQPVVDQTFWLS